MVEDKKAANIKDASWLETLISVVEEIRKVHPEATANQILTFLQVARHPNVSQRELCKHVGLTDGTVSRIIAVLSDRGLGERAGANIISIDFAPGDFRTRAQNLTAKGHRLLSSLRDLMR